MKISLPENVKAIIETLQKHGYEGYAVGGCVRDSILGREPDDWDITTSAKPGEVKELYRCTVDTGIQHGTVMVLLGGGAYEVTTYRIDGEYEDSRRPNGVFFTASLEEDLLRRDFTINAMAYNEQEGLVDIFSGIRDLENGVIRCVGEARLRLTEDALRILRAVRFCAQLGFRIEAETKRAIQELASNLSRISAERIQAELVKLLVSKHPEYLEMAYELGITAVILPEFDTAMKTGQNNPHHIYSVGRHILEALKYVEADKCLRLAVLFHDLGKPRTRSADSSGRDHFYGHEEEGARIADEVLHRLKFDNDTIAKVTKLVKYHDVHPALEPRSVRKLIHKVGEEIFPMLLQVQKADILAQSDYKRAEKCRDLETVQQIYEGIIERQECLSLRQLAVTGHDLIGEGMRPGREMGRVLERLLDHVLEYPEHNHKAFLIEYSRNFQELQK